MNLTCRPQPRNRFKFLPRIWPLAVICTAPALMAQPEFPYQYAWDTELLSMDLNAHNVLMPLGPGWSPILTDIHIGESASLASKGKAYASKALGIGSLNAPAAASPPQQGEQFFVQSFFDVFFDISVKDVDPGVNFGSGANDGLSLTYANNGPGYMQNFYQAAADPNAPNYGLIPPPESAPAIGWFTVEIPLGVDYNANGENDKIKFTLAALSAGDANRTFITLPDGTVIDNFDAILDISGAVVDESQDPPFGPIQLTGPTTASSRLDIPEPRDYALFAGVGLLGFALWRRRRA